MSSGIGVFLSPNQAGQYLVTRVVPGGPADLTGQVRHGDTLVQLGGQTLEGLSIDGVRNCILGPPGSFVDITVQRIENGRGQAISREPSPMRQPSPMPGSLPPQQFPGFPMAGPAIGRPFAQHRPSAPQLHPRMRQQMAMQQPRSNEMGRNGSPTAMSPGPMLAASGMLSHRPIEHRPHPFSSAPHSSPPPPPPRARSAFDPRAGPAPDSAPPYNPNAPPPPRILNPPYPPPPPGYPGPRPRGASVPPPRMHWQRASQSDQSPGPARPPGFPGQVPHPDSARPMSAASHDGPGGQPASDGPVDPRSFMLRGRPGAVPVPVPSPLMTPLAGPRPMSVGPMSGVRARSVSPSPYYQRAGPMPVGHGLEGGPGAPQGGLGLTLRNDVNGDLRVTEVQAGGPAHVQGTLRRGDVLTDVDGVTVRGWTVVQARAVIMGPAGSPVQVGALRPAPGHGDPRQWVGGGPGPAAFKFRLTLVRDIVPASRESVSADPSPLRSRPGPGAATASASGVHLAAHPPLGNGFNGQLEGPDDDIESSVPPPPPGGRAARSLDMEIARGVEGGGSGTAAGSGHRSQAVQVNEGMCGIGVFLGWSEEGLVSVKHVSPDGPAAGLTDIRPGDYLVAIDAASTERMPRRQVRDMIVGRRGTVVRLTLRRLLLDPATGQGSLTPVFDVDITREPPSARPGWPAGTGSGPVVGPALLPAQLDPAAVPLHLQQPDQQPQRIITTPRNQGPPALPMPQQHQPLHAADPDPPTDPPPPGMEGKCSVGIDLIEFDGALIIQGVHPNRPAERSGLVVKGDLVHRIDYRTVSEMSLAEVLPLMEGPDKSSVVLGLIKPRFRLRVNVRLQREWIEGSQDSVRAMPVNSPGQHRTPPSPSAPALIKTARRDPQPSMAIAPIEPPALAPFNPHTDQPLSPAHSPPYATRPARQPSPDQLHAGNYAADYVTDVTDLPPAPSPPRSPHVPPPFHLHNGQLENPAFAGPSPPRLPIGEVTVTGKTGPPSPPPRQSVPIAPPRRQLELEEGSSGLEFAPDTSFRGDGGMFGGEGANLSVPVDRPLPPGPDIAL